MLQARKGGIIIIPGVFFQTSLGIIYIARIFRSTNVQE